MSLENEVTKIETAFKEVETDIKLDYNKIMAILRSILPQEHPKTQEAINEVKKLGGGTQIPEPLTAPVTLTGAGPIANMQGDADLVQDQTNQYQSSVERSSI